MSGAEIPAGTLLLARRCPFPPCGFVDFDAMCARCTQSGRRVHALRFTRDGHLEGDGPLTEMLRPVIRLSEARPAQMAGRWLVFARFNVRTEPPPPFQVVLATPADWLAVASGLAPYAIVGGER